MAKKKTKKDLASAMEYSFKGKLWKYEGHAGWCFITLPKMLSKKIRSVHNSSEEGWGRLQTCAFIGDSSWKTAIWFDTKSDAYLLPVKLAIRKKEKLEIGQSFAVKLQFEIDDWLMSL